MLDLLMEHRDDFLATLLAMLEIRFVNRPWGIDD